MPLSFSRFQSLNYQVRTTQELETRNQKLETPKPFSPSPTSSSPIHHTPQPSNYFPLPLPAMAVVAAVDKKSSNTFAYNRMRAAGRVGPGSHRPPTHIAF